MQAAIKTHLSQLIGAGALVGQHGMSPVIPSAVADVDISSAIADIDWSEGTPAMTGRDSGANVNPAIIRIASSRRMAIWQCTPQNPTVVPEMEAFLANDPVKHMRAQIS
jgi:hypothetical protein